MGDEEIDRFLRTQARAVVVALDAEGLPSGGVGRLVIGAGAVGFALRAEDPVVRLLGRDDRACCIAEQFPSYYGIRGVMLHGRARVAAAAGSGEAAFDLAVERVVSYDFGKLLAP